MGARKRDTLPAEAVASLRQRLAVLPLRNGGRTRLLSSFAELYAVSVPTVRRVLWGDSPLRSASRSDKGKARVAPSEELHSYCRVIAALKLRTTNRKGRHISTARAIGLLEDFGVETPDGLVQPRKGLLRRATVDRHLDALGLNHDRLTRPPPATRFQAEHANDLWHFDLSPSDLKQLETPPPWVDLSRSGHPQLVIYSVVDDRSGSAYNEYHCVFGEDVEAGLRFLFNAMAPKGDPAFVLQGRPKQLYCDNGPIRRSKVFQRVCELLDITLLEHLPTPKGARLKNARAKGKVERPFRTVKEAHETPLSLP